MRRGPSSETSRPAVRMIVLALLVLGMVLQPVLAAVGEYHDIEHDRPGTHAHALHASDVPGDPGQQSGTGTDVPPDDDEPALHVLLHFAHCCGATAAMLAGGPVNDPLQGSDAVVAVEPQAPRQRPLQAPFKPPITA